MIEQISIEFPIGGFFSFETNINQNNPEWIFDVIKVQSGRMALLYELQNRDAKTIWLPHFYCETVATLLKKLGYDIKFYRFNDHFRIILPNTYSKKDIIVLVDYFGLTSQPLIKDIDFFEHKNVIVDATMSLWIKTNSKVPIFYSPRKFFGIPDGGFLKNPSRKISLKKYNSYLSKKRSYYLHLRKIGLLEKGREAFTEAEQSLNLDTRPMSISSFTQNLILNVDFDLAFTKRINNYSYLEKRLSNYGIKSVPIPKKTAPLCFPMQHQKAQYIIKTLAEKSIFCPKYWPNLILPKNDSKGIELLNKTVYLPIDQRYGRKEMDYILDNLEKIISI